MVGQGLRAFVGTSEGAGALTGDGVRTGSAEHPVCGDQVEIDVRLHGGSIGELRFRARGCPATQAVAALAAATLVGSAPAAAPMLLRAALREHGDLAVHERHAEVIVVRALQAACRGGG
jgi:NifU-like protein involved in Fe-S cluster formation